VRTENEGKVMDYYSRRRTYGTARGKFCGDCVHARKPRKPDYEGHLHCKPTGAKFAFVTGEFFPACGQFKTLWQAERELLERMGQKCIQFVTRVGVTSPQIAVGD
jgi:hypothetical protein